MRVSHEIRAQLRASTVTATNVAGAMTAATMAERHRAGQANLEVVETLMGADRHELGSRLKNPDVTP